MLAWPWSRRVLIARLRRVAMFSRPWLVRIFEASSPKAVSRTKWSRFSMVHGERASSLIRCGGAS